MMLPGVRHRPFSNDDVFCVPDTIFFLTTND